MAPNVRLTASAVSRANRAADFISFITNPALILIGSLAALTSHYADNSEEFWRWMGIGVFLLLGPSLAYVAYTWKRQDQIDIDITRREDRIVPLMLVSVGALFGGYLVQSRLHNESLLLVSNVLVAMLVLLTVVTFVWKISLHAATLTATISLLTIFRGPEFAWLYLLVLPVAWARLTLKQHTPAQLLGGSLVGVAITFVAAWLFRS